MIRFEKTLPFGCESCFDCCGRTHAWQNASCHICLSCRLTAQVSHERSSAELQAVCMEVAGDCLPNVVVSKTAQDALRTTRFELQ